MILYVCVFSLGKHSGNQQDINAIKVYKLPAEFVRNLLCESQIRYFYFIYYIYTLICIFNGKNKLSALSKYDKESNQV